MITFTPGSDPERERFTGKEFDREGEDAVNGVPGMNAYYFEARFHDPEIGMWMSEDPEDEFWNSYVYCGNDPLNLIDPTGSKIEGLNTGDNGTMSSMANAIWFIQLSENAPFLANLMWNLPIKFGKGAIVAATFANILFNTWAEISNQNWEAVENGVISGLMPIGGVCKLEGALLKNFQRFIKKLPANAKDLAIHNLPNGGNAFTSLCQNIV